MTEIVHYGRRRRRFTLVIIMFARIETELIGPYIIGSMWGTNSRLNRCKIVQIGYIRLGRWLLLKKSKLPRFWNHRVALTCYCQCN